MKFAQAIPVVHEGKRGNITSFHDNPVFQSKLHELAEKKWLIIENSGNPQTDQNEPSANNVSCSNYLKGLAIGWNQTLELQTFTKDIWETPSLYTTWNRLVTQIDLYDKMQSVLWVPDYWAWVIS